MKILALHPRGTSAQLFERQIAPLVRILGTTHEFVYVNGPLECERAKDVPTFVKGPFYTWYEGLSPRNVKEAHDTIHDVLEDDGPFDGVLAFSQGASLVLSMLLHHQLHQPHKPPPFRFAIFFCSVMVVSPDQAFNAKEIAKYSKYYEDSDPGLPADDDEASSGKTNGSGHDETEEVDSGNNSHVPVGNPGRKSLSKPVKSAPKHRGMLLLRSQREALVRELVELVKDLELHGSSPQERDHKWRGNKIDEFPRIYHPLTLRERVAIPTVHILGTKDPLYNHGTLGVRLCDKKKAKTIETDAGHAMLPSSVEDLRAVAAAVEWAMQQSLYI